MIVYVAFKNSIDWSDGRSYFQGVYGSKKAAAEGATAGGRPDWAQKLLDGDPEISAYYTIKEFEVEPEEAHVV